jgi:thiol-disulfide isomerase/thioredoxin
MSYSDYFKQVMPALKPGIPDQWPLILAVIVFGVAIYLFYYYYLAPKLKQSFKPNREHGTSDSSPTKDAELLFFYVDWCPHCKTAKPIWEELKAENEEKPIVAGYTIKFTEVNCTNETADVVSKMDEFKIEGYPTIKLKRNGQIIEYDAKPSKATLIQFLQAAL